MNRVARILRPCRVIMAGTTHTFPSITSRRGVWKISRIGSARWVVQRPDRQEYLKQLGADRVQSLA